MEEEKKADTISKKSTIDLVREFHKEFQPSYTFDKIVEDPNVDRLKLRVSLIFEELKELAIALGVYDHFQKLMTGQLQEHEVTSFNYNSVEAIDALSDLQYVLDGAYDELGMSKIKDEAFNIVHESNMSKLCMTDTEKEATIEFYHSQGTEVIFKNNIAMRADGKILKNFFYNSPKHKLIQLIVNNLDNELGKSDSTGKQETLFSGTEE